MYMEDSNFSFSRISLISSAPFPCSASILASSTDCRIVTEIRWLLTNDETEHRYIQELMSYKIEGLIVLSHTLSSRELSDLQIPVVAIEREDQFVSSVNTDNYLGAYEATSLLIHNHCDVLIHLNSPTKENVPAYRRLAGFQDACIKAGVPHKVIIRDFGLSYQEAAAPLQEIFDNIEQKYAGQKKGIFLSNDDHANILLNLLIRKYHTLPNDYELIGFDGAPISEQPPAPARRARRR